MKGTRAASRYAKSLLDLTIETGKVDDVHKDMLLFSESIKDSKDLRLLLKSPVVKADKKATALDSIFGKKVSDVTMKFIQIILKKRREALLEMIAEEFVAQYKRHKNIITAHVTSAVPLDDTLRNKVIGIVKETGAGVDLIEKVDTEIIGGLIVRVEDKQVDASIARKLNDLKQEFSKNPFIADF